MKNKRWIDCLSSKYINRELSWLSFNYRVLAEARKITNPLLERIKFLSISDKNLDEFYMVRVAGLKKKSWSGINSKSVDGLTINEQLTLINQEARRMIKIQGEIWEELDKELKNQDIVIIHSITELEPYELKSLQLFFEKNIFPILSPLAVDPAHPFPLIPNDSLGIVLKLQKKNKDLNAIIALPKNTNRFIKLKENKFVPLELLIKHYFDKLFPGFKIKDHSLFHIIRDNDLSLADAVDEDDDLREIYRDAIKRRRHAEVIRLILDKNCSEALADFIQTQLELDLDDIFRVDTLMNYSDLEELCKIKNPHLHFPEFVPRLPSLILDYDYFAAIKNRDIVVHHPYESFDVVVQFLEQASKDPQVIAIKQMLYRTGPQSSIVKALVEAAERGKYVTAVVELKARFEEETNIKLAEVLEKAGVQVIYGFIDYKTHSKITAVIRSENNESKIYCHLGTGNYNPVTAQVYTDISLLTCDEIIGKDTIKIFNYLTGYAEPEKLQKISISPLNLQKKLLELIDIEIENSKKNKAAQIWAKLNAILDPVIIDKLYEASQAGVKMDLVIRGICGLKPGLKGLSENIKVKSIVGRFLEHSRIVCFANGQNLPSENAKVFISSSDWMQRSFYHRIETLIPVENPMAHKQILEQIMKSNLDDDLQSWSMNPDGSYVQIPNGNFSAQEFFMTHKSLMDLS